MFWWTKSKFLDHSSKWGTSNEITTITTSFMNLRALQAGGPKWIQDHQSLNASVGSQKLQRARGCCIIRRLHHDWSSFASWTSPSFIPTEISSMLFLIWRGIEVWKRINYNIHSIHVAPWSKDLDFVHQTFPSCGGSDLGMRLLGPWLSEGG